MTKTTWIPRTLLPFPVLTMRDVLILSFLLVFVADQGSCEVTERGVTVGISIAGVLGAIVFYACIAGCIYLCVRASRDTGGPVGVYQQPQPYGAPNPYGGQNPYGGAYQPTMQPDPSQPVGTGGETGAVGSNYGTANY